MLPRFFPEVPTALADRGVTLRARGEGDEAFLRDVYVAYRWAELEATGWPEGQRLAFLHEQHRLQDHQYRAHYEGMGWGIIEVAGVRAGRLYLLLRGDELRIVDIALTPEHRGHGIGGALLTAIQRHASTVGAALVSIHVEANNPALRLYERLGFRHIEWRGVYRLLNWQCGAMPGH